MKKNKVKKKENKTGPRIACVAGGIIHLRKDLAEELGGCAENVEEML